MHKAFLGIVKSNIMCDPNRKYTQMTAILPLSARTNYRCTLENAIRNLVPSSSTIFVLKSYSE